MTTPDLPPVGATVGQWTFDGEEWYSATGGYAPHGADPTRVWRAEQRLAAIDAACLEVCRDNHGPTVGADAVDPDAGRYVCMDEDGEPIIDTSDPAEVIRRLDRLWETAVKRHEDAEQRIKAWRAEYDAATELLATVMSQRDDLTQRLATFEALAREARDLMVPPMETLLGVVQYAQKVARVTDRLAALATPVEDTAHG